MGAAGWTVLGGLAIGALALLATVLWLRLRRTERQVRLLRHCYLGVTDWVVMYSAEIADKSLAAQWNDKLAAQDRMMEELGLEPLGPADRVH